MIGRRKAQLQDRPEALPRPSAAPGRRERKREETRQKIYRAAMRLFAERGFFETTTEQITEAADVGQGTFFNYFPTKQHVLMVLSEIQYRKSSAAVEQVLAGKESVQEILHRLIHEIVKEPGQSRALTRALFSAVLSSEFVRDKAAEMLGEGRKNLATMIAAGQQRGEIRRDRKAADLALACQRAITGTLLLWAMHPGVNLKTWLDKAFQDFWAGAAAPKGRAS